MLPAASLMLRPTGASCCLAALAPLLICSEHTVSSLKPQSLLIILHRSTADSYKTRWSLTHSMSNTETLVHYILLATLVLADAAWWSSGSAFSSGIYLLATRLIGAAALCCCSQASICAQSDINPRIVIKISRAPASGDRWRSSCTITRQSSTT